MNTQQIAELAAAIRQASEGDDTALVSLPLAGASLDHMTIVSCAGKIYNDLRAAERLNAHQKSVIEHLRGEVDERANIADDLTHAKEKLGHRNYEQSVTIAALQREIAALKA